MGSLMGIVWQGHMAILAQEHATEQSLALLAKKAKHATKAMQLYSKSIEKEVEQLLQASASLCHDRSGTSSQQVDNLRLDIETWSSRLHVAMQEIKAITSAIEVHFLPFCPSNSMWFANTYVACQQNLYLHQSKGAQNCGIPCSQPIEDPVIYISLLEQNLNHKHTQEK